MQKMHFLQIELAVLLLAVCCLFCLLPTLLLLLLLLETYIRASQPASPQNIAILILYPFFVYSYIYHSDPTNPGTVRKCLSSLNINLISPYKMYFAARIILVLFMAFFVDDCLRSHRSRALNVLHRTDSLAGTHTTHTICCVRL